MNHYHTFCPRCRTEYYEAPHNNECDWCVPEVQLIEVSPMEHIKRTIKEQAHVHQPKSRN
jgi:hypothetical protein